MLKFLIPIFYGKTEKGKLLVEQKDKFVKYLLNLGDREIQIKVEPKKKIRTNNENRYYWGVIIAMISDHYGADGEQIHAHFKSLFLRIGGDKIPICKSTAELSTTEFEDYMSKCRMWCSTELNLNIPLPNEVDNY